MRTNRAWWWLLAVAPVLAFTFQGATTLTVSRQGLMSSAVDVVDLNRDGVADVVSLNVPRFGIAGSSSIGVLLGVRGAVNTGTLLELPVTGTPMEVRAADFTGDGNPDIAVLVLLDTTAADRARVCVYPGNGAGGFGFPLCSGLPGIPSRMTPGDFNRDGLLDLMLVRTGDSAVMTMLNTGSAFFTPGPSASVGGPVALAVADLNGDGMPDAAVVSQSGLLTLLLSGATSLFQTQQTWSMPAGANDIVAADFNRDGRADVMIANPVFNTITTGFGQASATAALRPLTNSPTPVAVFALRAADLNGDQSPEILAASAAGIIVFSTQPDGTLTAPNLPGAPPISQRPLGVGDVNGDGRLDTVAISIDGNAAGPFVLLGQATATVTRIEAPTAPTPYGLTTAITIRVQLAQPLPTALPLTGASVQLLDGGRELQRVPLTAPVGGAITDLATARVELVLPAGDRDLTARFLGTAAYLGSESAVARVTVQASSSTVRFQGLPADVSYTQGLRFNAVVIGPLVQANEGIVRVMVNGAVVSQGLVTAGLSQLFIPPGMPLGRIRVRLAYEGTNFLPSTSEEVQYVVKGGTVTAVSAASYRATVAPDSFAVLAVPGLVRAEGAVAGDVPWPKSLGGVEAELRDAAGGSRVRAGITYAGTGQVNIQVPAETPAGARRIVVLIDLVEAASGELQVNAVAPGLFTANGSGSGAPAAYAALYGADGQVRDQAVFTCATGRCVPAALDLGSPVDSLVLTVFGTGWRNARTVTASIDGRPAEILFTGAQPTVPGLDQANIRVPRELAGRGEIGLSLIADGVPTNGTRILVQ